MRWFGDAGVIPFDVSAGSFPAEWFRFVSAPGTSAFRVHAQVTLNSDQTKGEVVLDSGNVAGNAEIRVNGQSAGVPPPWRQEITGLLKEGADIVEEQVHHTLSNHYQTIPSHYRGDPLSGLLGPVRLLSRDWPAP